MADTTHDLKTDTPQNGTIVAGPEAHRREGKGDKQPGETTDRTLPDDTKPGTIVAGPEAHEQEGKGDAPFTARSKV